MQKKLYVLYIFVLAVLVAGFIAWSGSKKQSMKHAQMSPITHSELRITDAYARASSPTAKVGAIFFVIENGTDSDVHLSAAKSDIAGKVELHTHKESGDGVMSMVEIEGGVDVAAGQRSKFKRGGNHVMLMGLNQSLKTGDTVEIELIFNNTALPVTVTVDNERKAQMAHKH
jgi:copper(I)-binding protein